MTAGLLPGGRPEPQAEWAELVRGWFPELADMRQTTRLEIEQHRDHIVSALEAGVTKQTLAPFGDVLAEQHQVAQGVNLRSRA